MLPLMASSMSALLGCGLLARSAEADMICRLAVAALDDLMVKPGFLDLGACRRVADRLDCRDLGFAETFDAGDAGTRRDAINMYGARAALRDAAPEFGAGHTEYVSQHP